MATLRLTVLTMLWLGQSARVWTQGSLPLQAPSLSFSILTRGRDIQLFSKVELLCTLPRNAPRPITVYIGRGIQSKDGTSFPAPQSVRNVRLSIEAVAANEGLYVCWYNSSSTGDISVPSSPVNLTISSLPQPKLSVQPAFTPIGGNYTINCQTTASFPNRTLGLYSRQLPVAGLFQLWGELALPDDSNGIHLNRLQVDKTEAYEFVCRLKVVDYNQHVYFSPLSNIVPGVAEEAPIRLVHQYQGSKCLGQLEVQIRSSWGPVCLLSVGSSRTIGHVACKELGCGTAFAVWSKVESSPDSSLGSIRCKGSEDRLRECQILEVQPSCRGQKVLEMACSDAQPTPKLSVIGYGEVSRLDISDEHSLELSCTFNAPWFGPEKLTMDVTRVSTQYSIYSKSIASGEEMKALLQAPVPSGEYTCKIGFRGSYHTGTSVVISVSKWHKPNVGLIIVALFTILSGAAILVYMCVCRVQKRETPNAVTTQEGTTVNPESSRGIEMEDPNMSTSAQGDSPGNLNTSPVR